MAHTGAARPLKVGVVGLGWAGREHLACYAALPGVEIVAIAAKETDLLAQVGEQYDVPHRFESWADLVEVPGLDAISIAVPTALHAPIAIAALDRGIHVLTEKPIARTADEAQAMVDAARAAGRVLDVTFNHRLRGDVQALAGIIAAGEIGRPYFARASWMRRRGIPGLGSWFTDRDSAGGGPLIDIGVHVLDFALHLLGEPTVVSVTAATYSELGPRGLGGAWRNAADGSRASAYDVEDFASAFLRLADGGTLSIETAWAVYREPKDLVDFRVFATDGGADLVIVGATETPAGVLTVRRDKGADIDDLVVETAAGPGHRGVVAAFVGHVRDPECWAEHDGSIGLERARIIDACYRSAEARKEVLL